MVDVPRLIRREVAEGDLDLDIVIKPPIGQALPPAAAVVVLVEVLLGDLEKSSGLSVVR